MKDRFLLLRSMKLLAMSWKLSPKNGIFTIFSTLIATSKRLLSMLIPAAFVNYISRGASFSRILLIIILICGVITIAEMTAKFFNLKLTSLGYALNNYGTLKICQKGMKLDYSCWDVSKYMDNNLRAVQSSWIFMGITDAWLETLLSGLLSIAVVSVVLLQINWWILPIIVVLSGFSVFIDKKNASLQHVKEKQKSSLVKKRRYNENLLFDVKYGKELRVFNAQSYVQNKFVASCEEVEAVENKKRSINAVFSILNNVVLMIQSFVLYLCSIDKYRIGILPVGNFLVYYSSMIQLKYAVSSVFTFYSDISEIDEYYSDIEEYLQTEESLRQGKGTTSKDNTFALECKSVCFRYPETDTNVIDNVSFSISNYDTLCIVGDNGSGKTTLVKLLMRLYDVSEGEIFLNGVNIKEIDYESYMSIVAPVFQDFQLHAFTLGENISFDKPLDKEKTDKIAEKLDMEDVIGNLNKGYDTMVTRLLDDDGVDFSGGECQKIAMLRAAYKDADLLILDEPTANIDPISEAKFYAEVKTVFNSKAIIFVSHRMSSAKIADKILVLDNGSVVEFGTFEQLLSTDGVFSAMYKKQADLYNDSISGK